MSGPGMRRPLADLIRGDTPPAVPPSPLERALQNVRLRDQEADDLRQRCRETEEMLTALRQRVAEADRRKIEAHQEFISELKRRGAESDRRREESDRQREESTRRHEERMRQLAQREEKAREDWRLWTEEFDRKYPNYQGGSK